jgi:hypothetical protein
LEPPATKNWEAEMAARASTLQHPGKQLMFFHELTLRKKTIYHIHTVYYKKYILNSK